MEELWHGNMLILERKPDTGYTLKCACGCEFKYAPASGMNTCIVNKTTRAICPECWTVWYSEGQPRFTKEERYYVMSVQVGSLDDSEFIPLGCGIASSAQEFVFSMLNDLPPISGYTVQQVPYDQYSQIKDLVAQLNEASEAKCFEEFDLDGPSFDELVG